MKLQVFIITISEFSIFSLIWYPFSPNFPQITSVSTKFLGHPKDLIPIRIIYSIVSFPKLFSTFYIYY
ncbi:hypothetical protein ES705_20977 [subsurface metagenome]